MRLRNHALNGVWESSLCFGQPGRSDIRMLLSSSDSEGPLPRFRESWSAVGGLGSWSALFRCYAAGWSDVTGAHVTCGATWKPRRCIAESKDTVSQMIGPTRHGFLGVQGLSTPENFTVRRFRAKVSHVHTYSPSWLCSVEAFDTGLPVLHGLLRKGFVTARVVPTKRDLPASRY